MTPQEAACCISNEILNHDWFSKHLFVLVLHTPICYVICIGNQFQVLICNWIPQIFSCHFHAF